MDTIEEDKKFLTALIAGMICAVDYLDSPNDPSAVTGPIAMAKRIVEAVWEDE